MYGDPAASPGTLQEHVVKLEVEFHAHWASQQALRAGQNPPACLDASSPGEAKTHLPVWKTLPAARAPTPLQNAAAGSTAATEVL